MRTQRGFTLIELMLVVTIAAVMLGIGVPAFREFMATQRVKNTAFDFAAALLLARSEAVKRNTAVTLAQAGGSWADGWTVVAGANTLHAKDAPTGVTVTPTDPATVTVAFQGNGRISAAADVTFQFGSANTPAVRCVRIGISGVPTTTSTACT